MLFRFPPQLDHVTASQVSISAVLHSTNVSRFELDAATLTFGSMDLPATFRIVRGWLHHVDAYPVSGFVFLCYFVIETLDLDLYRLDLDVIASPAGSNDPIGLFWMISAWLRGAGAL